MANIHFDVNTTGGGILGSLSTLCAIMLGTINVHTFIQTAVCAGIGAGVGYVVTYSLKRLTGFLERKFKWGSDKPET